MMFRMEMYLFREAVRADHDVFRLQQPSHHVQDGGFSDCRLRATAAGNRTAGLVLDVQRGVPGHEEVTPWSGY